MYLLKLKFVYIIFVFLLLLFKSKGVFCSSDDDDSINNNVEIKKNKLENYIQNNVNIQSENDLLYYLYDICLSDDYCKKAYYQNEFTNITIFKILIKNVISSIYSESYKYDINIDATKVISSIIFKNSNTAFKESSLLNTLSNINSNTINYSINNNSNSDNDLEVLYSQFAEMMLANELTYSMYYFQINNDQVMCFPGQKAVMNEDGLQISCMCQENQNCSQSSMFNMTYINLTLALLIVLSLLIISIFTMRLFLDWMIFHKLTRKRHANIDNDMLSGYH
jgi:hypothetical protein